MRIRLILFVLLLGLGTVIGGWGAVQNGLLEPWCRTAAFLSEQFLKLFGSGVVRSGATLSDPESHHAIYVSWGCSGADATFILVSAILVYPTSISAKVLGLISGFVAVQGLNVIRIVTLYQLNIYSQQLFNFAHSYLWQGLLMLDVLVFLMLWLRWQRTQCAIQ